ncbi:MAG TPA: response regulator [Anaerolineae bacterium]|nr:response regulator [Anaerolineae bacterium]
MEKKAKILVIDDDPDVTEATTIILEAQGYEVITAHDGIEGLQKIKEEVPDLIILDLLMPRLDGFGVVRELKENPRYAKYDDIPILILTAVREDASRRRYELETGLEMDVDDYVEKPTPPEELLHRVAKLLGKKKGG